MDQLIRSLTDGRTARRRRAFGASATLAVLLLALVAGRAGRSNRISRDETRERGRSVYRGGQRVH